MNSLRLLQSNLLALGPRRLIVLGLSLASVVALVLLVTYSLGRPGMEVLYTGLDAQDVSRIGDALGELGVNFDVSADGKSIQVAVGSAPRARMLLAERGLPKSPSAGYELFDALGPLGLTSFMQEVTRVRALEGELARTVQLIDGIRAARVHLVLPDPNTLHTDQREASASVVIRADGGGDRAALGQTIRHLVAGAVPTMKINRVTVMTTDGTIVAAGGEAADAGVADLFGLERMVSNEIEAKIRTTLAPYLGLDNFRSTVVVKLNTDRRQSNETKYDPDSKVERSVRVIKDTGSSRDTSDGWQTTVEQNIPGSAAKPSASKGSSQDTLRKEEVTNYEIGSKTDTIDSKGYTVDALSVAIVINHASLVKSLGTNATPDSINAQIQEIQSLVSSAAGIRSQRGDTVKIMSVDFQPASSQLEAAPPAGIGAFFSERAGILINAATVLIVAALVIMLGVRPATRMLLQPPALMALPDDSSPQRARLSRSPNAGSADGAAALAGSNFDNSQTLPAQSAQRRLEQLIEFDEDGAVGILKDWIRGAAPR